MYKWNIYSEIHYWIIIFGLLVYMKTHIETPWGGIHEAIMNGYNGYNIHEDYKLKCKGEILCTVFRDKSMLMVLMFIIHFYI